jgi:glycosyltransferase involved in cell wall biosynthesis
MAAAAASRLHASARLLTHAGSPQSLRLYRQARRVNARLYIGHTLAALPAAVLAAEARGAAAGFDAEDCHSMETYDAERNRVAGLVERCFLPRCTHLTASSPLIAAEYRRRYGVEMIPILNVFDSPTRCSEGRRPRSRTGPLSLYWFSQTVGAGRGLEQVIAGAALAKSDVQLCFRGIVNDAYRQRLVQLGRDSGLAREIRLLEPAAPDSMIEKAAEHDVGLSLELSTPPNHDLALSNKLFTYLAAGLPQIVSRTAAQSRLAEELGKAAILVDLKRPAEIAAAIDGLASSAGAYAAAASEAERLHRDRYSWSVESRKLVEAVGRVLRPGAHAELVQNRSAGQQEDCDENCDVMTRVAKP